MINNQATKVINHLPSSNAFCLIISKTLFKRLESALKKDTFHLSVVFIFSEVMGEIVFVSPLKTRYCGYSALLLTAKPLLLTISLTKPLTHFGKETWLRFLINHVVSGDKQVDASICLSGEMYFSVPFARAFSIYSLLRVCRPKRLWLRMRTL